MALEKVTGVTAVLVLCLAGGLVRRRLRAVRRSCDVRIVQCGEVAFFVLQPVSGRGKAGARGQKVGDKNCQHQAHNLKSEAQQTVK